MRGDPAAVRSADQTSAAPLKFLTAGQHPCTMRRSMPCGARLNTAVILLIRKRCITRCRRHPRGNGPIVPCHVSALNALALGQPGQRTVVEQQSVAIKFLLSVSYAFRFIPDSDSDLHIADKFILSSFNRGDLYQYHAMTPNTCLKLPGIFPKILLTP